jgi:hypothetical protein
MRGNKMAKMSGFGMEISMLSGESFVPVELLMENEELVKMILNDTPHEELLTFINENY